MSRQRHKTSPEVNVGLIEESDIDGAVTCIQTAFADDPYSNWVFNSKKFSKTRNHASLRTRCLWGMKHASFYVAKPVGDGEDPNKVLGVAMWQPPSLARPAPHLTWTEYLLGLFSPIAWTSWISDQTATWSLWFAQLRTNVRHGRGGLIVRRYWKWKEAQAEAQSSIWDDSNGYYFCNIVTVLPEAQGLGVGKALMNVVLKQADAENRKSYLESSRETPNVEIYQRMGFQVVRTMHCKDGEADTGVKLYCMMREPQDHSD